MNWSETRKGAGGPNEGYGRCPDEKKVTSTLLVAMVMEKSWWHLEVETKELANGLDMGDRGKREISNETLLLCLAQCTILGDMGDCGWKIIRWGDEEFYFIHFSFGMQARLQSEDVKEVVAYINLKLSGEVKAGGSNSEVIGIKFMMV